MNDSLKEVITHPEPTPHERHRAALVAAGHAHDSADLTLLLDVLDLLHEQEPQP